MPDSSIGKKFLMAATGLILLAFVIGHLLGNLLVFAGPEALNGYARKLRDLGELLWLVRVILIAAIAVHIWTSVALAHDNARARPIGYTRFRTSETTWAARTMLLSGIIVLAYILYHLLHFTFRVAHPALTPPPDPAGHPDVYAMVVRSFQRWPICAAYLAGVGCVCLHLSHGAASAFQTLGLNDARTLPVFTAAGRIIATLIFLGYAAIPLAVLAGFVR